ncbi:MAG: hypothetical protein ABI369_02830 [Acetobacteraceae bacterium]
MGGEFAACGGVLACAVALLSAARIAASAMRNGLAFLLLGSWGFAMLAFVAMAVAFQAFAWGTPPSFNVAARFISANGVPLAAILLLGAVTAAGIGLLRPAGRFGGGDRIAGRGAGPRRVGQARLADAVE